MRKLTEPAGAWAELVRMWSGILLLLPMAGIANSVPEAISTYVIRPSEDLQSVVVEAQFATGVDSLEARTGDVRKFEELAGCKGETVEVRGKKILTNSIQGCLRYRYPLIQRSDRRSPPVRDGVVVSEPSDWLWAPKLDESDKIHIELSLPTAMEASVPWRELGPGRFELVRSPGSSTGSVIFGQFSAHEIEIADARIRVALIDGPGASLDREKTLRWLRTAGSEVARVGGKFPNPDLQVIVQPVAGHGRSAVPFGYVIRDGGEAVRFFVDPTRPLEDYLGDWTAIHEFSHLLLPYVRSREKWISEGFASYYQNVLMARRGEYSESEAWNRLHRSFEQARKVRSPPRLDQLHRRPFWEVRILIYWSGAAMALLADTRLRTLSEGRESLDTVLGRLQECCLPSGSTWRAEELFEKLD
ncbi:MAG: hypothetical protein ACC642_02340 [Pseudomonadales bacterium]